MVLPEIFSKVRARDLEIKGKTSTNTKEYYTCNMCAFE